MSGAVVSRSFVRAPRNGQLKRFKIIFYNKGKQALAQAFHTLANNLGRIAINTGDIMWSCHTLKYVCAGMYGTHGHTYIYIYMNRNGEHLGRGKEFLLPCAASLPGQIYFFETQMYQDWWVWWVWWVWYLIGGFVCSLHTFVCSYSPRFIFTFVSARARWCRQGRFRVYRMPKINDY